MTDFVTRHFENTKQIVVRVLGFVLVCRSGGGPTKRPSVAPGTPPPAMTSGKDGEAPTVTASAPHNGENKPPQAIVKPQVLTHVIEGFVIQEGAEPFPVCVSGRSHI